MKRFFGTLMLLVMVTLFIGCGEVKIPEIYIQPMIDSGEAIQPVPVIDGTLTVSSDNNNGSVKFKIEGLGNKCTIESRAMDCLKSMVIKGHGSLYNKKGHSYPITVTLNDGAATGTSSRVPPGTYDLHISLSDTTRDLFFGQAEVIILPNRVVETEIDLIPNFYYGIKFILRNPPGQYSKGVVYSSIMRSRSDYHIGYGEYFSHSQCEFNEALLCTVGFHFNTGEFAVNFSVTDNKGDIHEYVFVTKFTEFLSNSSLFVRDYKSNGSLGIVVRLSADFDDSVLFGNGIISYIWKVENGGLPVGIIPESVLEFIYQDTYGYKSGICEVSLLKDGVYTCNIDWQGSPPKEHWNKTRYQITSIPNSGLG